MHRRLIFLFLLISFQSPAFSEPTLEMKVNELSKLVHELQQTVAIQQSEIDVLKSARGINVPGQAVAAGSPEKPSSATSGRWNPDIGVIADALFKHDSPQTDAGGADRLSIRELELVMGSYVDAYSRMDVNIALSDFEDVHIQEAYLTRFGLPWETTARIGRSKPKVGKALLFHRDILDTVDYPLVIQRYFGDDGLNKTGVDLTRSLDLPFNSAHEISAGIIEGGNGEGGTVYGDARRRPTVYSHLKNFWDISDVTNFELGASHMIGSSDDDGGMENNIAGVDGTLMHFYGPDQRIKLQSELFYLNQRGLEDENRLGTYGHFDVKFHKRWSAGLRFDYAQLVNHPLRSSGGTDSGYTGYITFFQTEFARWRLQYNHIESSRGKDDDQFLIQGIFAIGEHKHKLQ
ncbi:MAG: hypothetical protein A2Z83_01580 [Omnitrophica bacterium GWA2_52_8]|nr:MAG: hypothetical protein A2Z83_01580 [Omnitrophica bacterium GWA2_52_8]